MNSPSRTVVRYRIVAVILTVVGCALPVGGVTELISPDHVPQGPVATGLWIFKLMLLVHAALFATLPRWVMARADGAPIRPREKIHAPEWVAVSSLLIVATLLRLNNLDHGIWHDEMLTFVRYARLPVFEIFTTYDSQNQHMLYSLLSRVSLVAFGESVWALRLPAVLLGVASVAAVFFLGLQVASRREAFAAAGLLTFSYHHVWFSQNARGYTGLLLWTVLATILWFRITNGHDTRFRTLLLYGVVIALAVFTHITGAVVALAHGIIYVADRIYNRSRSPSPVAEPLIALLLAVTLSIQLYAVSLPQVIAILTHSAPAGPEIVWKDPMWLALETLRGLATGVPGGWLSVSIGALIVTAGVLSFARQDPRLAAAMLLPGILLVGSLIATNHNLWPRFLFFVGGFAVLFLIRGIVVSIQTISTQRTRSLSLATLVLIVALSAAQVPAAWLPKQDYESAQAFIESRRAPGDAVVTIDMADYGFNTYRHARYSNAATIEDLRQIEGGHPRTWVVYTFPIRMQSTKPELWQHVDTKYRTVAQFAGTVTGGTIFLKVRP